jgi:putative inorganic carbon (HCO3(-)) transporter
MNAQIIRILALTPFDNWWQSTWSSSMLGQLTARLKKTTTRPILQLWGGRLQELSFLGVLLLISTLALPQFTDDKEALALIALASSMCFALGALLGGKEQRHPLAIDIPVYLFAAVNVIAAFSSHYFHESLYGLLKLLVYFVSYWLFTAILEKSPKRKFIVLACLLVSASLVALYGLYQYKIGVAPLATWEDPNVEIQGTRIFSTLKNPNLLAGYLVPLAPLATALTLALACKKRWWTAFSAALVAILITAATVLTSSRGGYIGLFTGFGALITISLTALWQSHPKRRGWIIATVICLPLMVFFLLSTVPTFEQRVSSIFAGREHSSNSYRMNVWLASLNMLKDNWWIGVGPGNKAFVLAYGLYMRSGFDALGTYCVPLEIAVEGGIFNLLFFVWLCLAFLARAHLCYWSSETNSSEKWLIAGSAAALVGMLAHGCVDTVFFRPQVQFIFWILIAVLWTARFTSTASSTSTAISISTSTSTSRSRSTSTSTSPRLLERRG